MTGAIRRQNILAELNEATGPINATKLAEMNGVTRQIIVADIALLRAAGNNIRAEHRGYVLDRTVGEIRKKIVCKHSKDAVTDELYAVVDNGGKAEIVFPAINPDTVDSSWLYTIKLSK